MEVVKEKTPSQEEMILTHLKRFGSIEPMTALREYGCYRLGARIFDLRRQGYAIRSHKVEATSARTGRRMQYVLYTLEGEAKNKPHPAPLR